MPADVIEVDFAAERRARMPLDERAEDLRNDIGTLRASIENEISWLEGQRRAERSHVVALKRSLAQERAANFPFSDDDVLGALLEVFRGPPVAATAVATALYGREATHSASVRVGLALSRLAASGRVLVAVPPDSHRTTEWAPMGRDDA